LEFVGEGNSVTIFGRVRKGENVKILGDFVDSENKLK
jgi:hypothetical protein